MAKLLITVMLGSLLSCGPVCSHVHTEECGENGVECTHECYEVTPKVEKPEFWSL